MSENKPVHIMCAVMRDPKGSVDVALRINIFPLPDDALIHQAVYEAARDAIHSKLTALGITSPTRHELPASKARTQ